MSKGCRGLAGLLVTASVIGIAGVSWPASRSQSRHRGAADAMALVGPVKPLAGLRFSLADKLVKSWLYEMVPCPSQGFTMYDYLRVESDDARRRGLNETFVLSETDNSVTVARWLTRADGHPLIDQPKLVLFAYTFGWPWFQLEGQLPANVAAQDPIGHVVSSTIPVCAQLHEGLDRHLIKSNFMY